MSAFELRVFLSLLGQCNYNPANKFSFHRLGKKLLREVNRRLNLNADIRVCAGGIAVSGEVILHADKVYIQVSADRRDLGILYRACNGRNDYTGFRNLWYSYGQLQRDGIDGLTRAIGAILPHTHTCPTCTDELTCNNPKCDIPFNPIGTCGAH